MILEILKSVHFVSGVVGICAGAWVVFGILTEKLVEKWIFLFLRCALTASVTGLCFPFDHLLPTHWAAISAVYVSALAVLSLQRYGLAGIWAPVFALSIMLVLCLDVLVAIAHVFDMLAPRQPKVLPILCELMVVVVCAGLGIFIQERYQNRPANLMSLHR